MDRLPVVVAAAAAAVALVTFGGGACERRAERSEAQRQSTTTITAAEVEAGRSTIDPNAAFEKMRLQYREQGLADLTSVDHRIEALESRASGENATTKAQLEAALSDIRLDRDVFAATLEAADRATPETWTARREAADHAWHELDNTLTRATRALPTEPFFDPSMPPIPPKTPMP
jgi:hypothetical protein